VGINCSVGYVYYMIDSWTWMSESELDGTNYNGQISSYEGSGYTQVYASDSRVI